MKAKIRWTSENTLMVSIEHDELPSLIDGAGDLKRLICRNMNIIKEYESLGMPTNERNVFKTFHIMEFKRREIGQDAAEN